MIGITNNVFLLVGAVLTQQLIYLQATTSATPGTSPPPPDACDGVKCGTGSICRYVAASATCAIKVQCVNISQIDPSADTECRANNLTEAILRGNKEDITYGTINCAIADPKCPSGAVCGLTSTDYGHCCRNKFFKNTRKPGYCVKDTLLCGTISCKEDSDCSDVQKCCFSCGNFSCTKPNLEISGIACGPVRCNRGEACVLKQAPCFPGTACTEVQVPTCVDAGCSRCKYDEFCNLTTEYQCVPNGLCNGCRVGLACFQFDIPCEDGICTEYRCAPEQGN